VIQASPEPPAAESDDKVASREGLSQFCSYKSITELAVAVDAVDGIFVDGSTKERFSGKLFYFLIFIQLIQVTFMPVSLLLRYSSYKLGTCLR